MKILVTGGAGFLGSNLVENLLKSDNEIVVIDNLITGKKENIEDFRKYENFSFIQADITEVARMLEPGFNQIYHLASPASPPKYMKFAHETMMVNTMATDLLCKYAIKNNSRILFSSTSEIYGDPEVHPQVEGYWGNVNPIGVRSVYDEAKRFGETLISHYSRTVGLNSIIVRIFNTYGPKMDPYDGRVISNFIRQIILGEKITIYGSGLQSRSFCFVTDMVEGLALAMNSKERGPINLGNPSEFTLIQLLEKIGRLMQVEYKLKYCDLPSDDPKRRNPCIDQAIELLGWQPRVTLDEGLEKTIDWLRIHI